MIRIHGSIQIPTTQVSQIKGLAVGLVRRYPLLKIASENGKCTEKELLTRWFGTKHGPFPVGTHVIHLVVFVGGRAPVWICDCGDAGDRKTQ